MAGGWIISCEVQSGRRRGELKIIDAEQLEAGIDRVGVVLYPASASASAFDFSQSRPDVQVTACSVKK